MRRFELYTFLRESSRYHFQQTKALPFRDLAWEADPNKSACGRSIRVGETAGVNHGGWANATDSFISGFWFIYEYGWLAQAGYDVVERQSLACSRKPGMQKGERCAYGILTNSPLFEATPDYWTSILWKQLCGNRVLNVTVGVATPGPDLFVGPWVCARFIFSS